MIEYDRQRLLERIVDWQGLGCSAGKQLEVRQRTTALLFPNDDQSVALASSKTMSNCMLESMAWMRAAGVVHPLLDAPYFSRASGEWRVVGKAPAWVQQIGRDLGAWRDPRSTDAIPQAGDVLVIGGFGGYEVHGFVVVTYTQLDGVLTSIDGGQGDHGADIEWRTRKLGYDHSDKRYWTWEGPSLDRRGRPVLGWCDLGAMLKC